MPTPVTPAFRDFLDGILKTIETIMPQFLEGDLEDRALRGNFVELVDAELARQYPLSRLLTAVHRRKVVGKVLDLVLDDVILNQETASVSLIGNAVEGFIVSAGGVAGESAQAAVARAVAAVLGGDWQVVPTPLGPDTFHVRNAGRLLSVTEAWSYVYALRKAPGITAAEPDFTLPSPVDEPPEQDFETAGAEEHIKESKKCEWSIENVFAPEAWKFSESEGRPSRGEGIIIGHPDTGYTEHPENWNSDPAQNRLLFKAGYDFWRNDPSALDDLDSAIGTLPQAGFVGFPGHGTGTSSVIFSSEGPTDKDHVTGTAPRAKLIPYRVAPTVVLLNQRRLADAIIRATDSGCHVVSISMGGPWSFYLHRALRYAVGKGVIVCCAAGNYIGASNIFSLVVWPAAYAEAVAVAGSNAVDGIWKGSSRGRQVDITAPGESVWRAKASKGQPLGEVGRGSGTSYAVATLAGIAACWLAHHGRKNLIDRYGAGNLAAVFRQLLLSHGHRRPSNWDTKRFGPGILNANQLLRAELPFESATVEFAMAEELPSERMSKLFDEIPGPQLRAGLSRLLNTPEPALNARLDELGDELGFHFYNDPVLRQRFQQEVTGTVPEIEIAGAETTPSSETLLRRAASPQLASSIGYR